MNIFIIAAVLLNLAAGWLPSSTNSVDGISMLNFIAATAAAYVWGHTSK